MNISINGAFLLAQSLYGNLLRPLAIKAVKETDSDVDDFVVEVLDKVFNYIDHQRPPIPPISK